MIQMNGYKVVIECDSKLRRQQGVHFPVMWVWQQVICIFTSSIKAYIAATHAKTVLQPVHLDASEPWEKWADLSRNSCDVIVAINLLQYSSFETAQVSLLI